MLSLLIDKGFTYPKRLTIRFGRLGEVWRKMKRLIFVVIAMIIALPLVVSATVSAEESREENIYSIVKALQQSKNITIELKGFDTTYISGKWFLVLFEGEYYYKIFIEYVDVDSDGWNNGDKLICSYFIDNEKEVRYVDEQHDGQIKSYKEDASDSGEHSIDTMTNEILLELHNHYRAVSEEVIRTESNCWRD